MTTAQGATTNEFQQTGEDFHGIRIDFEKVSNNLKDFLALRNQPERDEELLESWKRADKVYRVLMPKSHDTALEVDAQISELLKAFDEANADDLKDVLRDSTHKLERFIKDGTRVAVDLSQLRHRVWGFVKTELEWRLQDYRLSLLRIRENLDEIKDVPLPIEQLFSDTFTSLNRRLTTMEHTWLKLNDDAMRLRQNLYMTSIEHGSEEFAEMKKEAYSFGLNMHRNIEAYALAVSSADRVPVLDA